VLALIRARRAISFVPSSGASMKASSTAMARETALTVRWAGFPVRAMLRSE
jgi:hypothetical protein